MAGYMVRPSGHGIWYGLVRVAWYGLAGIVWYIWYGMVGIAWSMVWPGRHGTWHGI